MHSYQIDLMHLSQPGNRVVYYDDNNKNNNTNPRDLKGIELKSEINNKAIWEITIPSSNSSSSNNKKS